jgi:serine protease inhibitor
MRSKAMSAALVLIVAAVCGCRSDDNSHVARLASWHASGANPRQQIVVTNTRFGINVLQELIRERPDQNVIVSPLNLGLALAMAYNGAAGLTQQQIGKALQVDGLPIEQVNREYQALSDAVRQADRHVEVDVANSLWLQGNWPFNAPYVDLCRQFYDAEVANVDMNAPEAAPTINAWASKQTRGHIPEIATPQQLYEKKAVALLLSAGYFSGKWTTPFEAEWTEPASFKLASGKATRVQMMAQRGEYLCLEGPTLQAISLPYESGRLSFYVFLPKAASSLKAFCWGLTADKWEQWMRQFAPRPGVLNLPRFQLQGDLPLEDTLKHLGMPDAFDLLRANFSSMSAEQVFISEARQRTYLHVHERGTEAAAIAQIMLGPGIIAPRSDQFAMVVDHPFLCAIRDNKSGTLLFMGAVTDPGNDVGTPTPPK